MRFASSGSLLIALTLAACQSTATSSRGDRASFIPQQSASPSAAPSASSSTAPPPAALVERAVRLEQDVDEAVITEAGGTYLGELVVTSQSTSAPSLYGIASLDAASHGGTHFYVKTFKTQSSSSTGFRRGRTRSGVATYAVYRVEPEAWSALPPKYRPVPTTPAPPTAP